MIAAAGRRLVSIVALATMLASACAGGDDDGGATVLPMIDEIAPAVAAVEAEMGAPQRYVEINATSQLVNLFVAVDDGDDGGEAVPYLYVDGELQPPAPSVPIDDLPTFTADAIDFAPDTVLDTVVNDLPNSSFGLFVVTAGAGSSVRYEVFVQSSQGGSLAVNVTGDGAVLGVERLDPS